eukprot:6183898-Pleurochrysis_carterae.AAC.10
MGQLRSDYDAFLEAFPTTRSQQPNEPPDSIMDPYPFNHQPNSLYMPSPNYTPIFYSNLQSSIYHVDVIVICIRIVRYMPYARSIYGICISHMNTSIVSTHRCNDPS